MSVPRHWQRVVPAAGYLSLLFTGQVATGGVRIYGPLLLLLVLWKPLNWVVGIIEDFVQRRAEKGKGKGQHDGGQR